MIKTLSGGILYFYPRSPCGERRVYLASQTFDIDISIHALLAESDVLERCIVPAEVLFLSTLSLRRATLATW